MRIAQVSQLQHPVPPQGYGASERIVSYLTEELVRQGHEVTLFAHPDSVTSARLIPPNKLEAILGKLAGTQGAELELHVRVVRGRFFEARWDGDERIG